MIRKRHVFFLSAALFVFVAAARPCTDARPTSASGSETSPVKIPILMYHKISEKPKSWGKYVISPKELEDDIKLLKSRGYTPISLSELVAYTQGKHTLPEKPVMLTFDDGNRSDYVYAFPLAQKYQVKMLSSPVGAYSEKYSMITDHNVDYAHLTWDEMHEMQASGLFEFQNHSYNLHQCDVHRKGCLKSRDESTDDYEKTILEDVKLSQTLFAEHGIPAPICFTYPFGSTNQTLLRYLKQSGFIATLGTYERVNLLTGEPEELFDLCRFNRPHGFDLRRMLHYAE